MGFNLEDYETVDSRIHKFYADHKDGRITTELLSDPNNIETAVVKAFIYVGDFLAATGMAFERAGEGGMANKTAHLENCETSAIGRALANYGYSGDKRSSREEMEKVERGEGSYADMELEIAGCPTLDDLRTVFERLKGKLTHNKAGLDRIVKAKDIQKAYLGAES